MLSDERSAATATGRLTQPYLRVRYVPAARAARASSEKVYAFFSSEKAVLSGYFIADSCRYS